MVDDKYITREALRGLVVRERSASLGMGAGSRVWGGMGVRKEMDRMLDFLDCM